MAVERSRRNIGQRAALVVGMVKVTLRVPTWLELMVMLAVSEWQVEGAEFTVMPSQSCKWPSLEMLPRR